MVMHYLTVPSPLYVVIMTGNIFFSTNSIIHLLPFCSENPHIMLSCQITTELKESTRFTTLRFSLDNFVFFFFIQNNSMKYNK